jgi:hypothetical protein
MCIRVTSCGRIAAPGPFLIQTSWRESVPSVGGVGGEVIDNERGGAMRSYSTFYNTKLANWSQTKESRVTYFC